MFLLVLQFAGWTAALRPPTVLSESLICACVALARAAAGHVDGETTGTQSRVERHSQMRSR